MRTALAVFCACLAVLPVAQGRTDWEDDPAFDTLVALNFKDGEARRILDMLFQMAGAPVSIDPCVRGRLSLELENVAAGTALTQIAEMLDLTIEARGGAYLVGCRDHPELPPARPGEAVTLRFVVQRESAEGNRHTIANPWLTMPYRQQAEIIQGSAAGLEIVLAEDGRPVLAGDTRRLDRIAKTPELSITAFYDPGDGVGPARVRGLFKISHYREKRGSLHTGITPFEVELSNSSTEPFTDRSLVEASRLVVGRVPYLLLIGRHPDR